jgi:arylsulfatase
LTHAQTTAQPPPAPAATPTACCDGAARGALLAKADPLAALPLMAGQPAGGKKPNILVIFGDDIGITNLSCYRDGLMGYETSNIDRIAK